MKTINFQYTGNVDLKHFIEVNKLKKEKNVLIQIFSGLLFKEVIINITSLLKKDLPQAHIIGTTTNGEIINGSAINNSITISFSIFENVELKSTFVDFDKEKKIKKDYNKVFESIINDKTKLVIIFSDWLTSEVEDILKNFHSFKPNIFVGGGKAGDNLHYKDCFVFNEDKIIDRGLVMVSLSADQFFVNNLYNFGWLEVGPPLKVTGSKGIVLSRINGETVVKAYKRYLGEEIANNLEKYGVEFPLIIERSGLKIARCPIKVNPDGSVIIAGYIKEGEILRFGVGNKDNILNYSHLLANSVIKKCPAETIFLYSSGSRKAILGEDMNSRLIIFQKLATTAGFFGNTQFFHDENDNYCLQLTSVGLILSEKDDKLDQNKIINIVKEKNIKDKNNYILFQIIENLQKEYNLGNCKPVKGKKI